MDTQGLSSVRPYSSLDMAGTKKPRCRGSTVLSTKGRVTIPQRTLEQLGLRPGDELKVEVDREGRIVFSPAARRTGRRRAIEETSGVLAGVYRRGVLTKLRAEWR
jgi:AbrB family looped-hinge helix DNA binding protein